MQDQPTTALVSIDPATTAAKICAAVAQGLEMAVKIYSEYIDFGGDAATLREASSNVSHEFWTTLEDIRTGRLHLKAYALPAPQRRALRALPAHEQEHIIDNGVDVLTVNGETLRVQLKNLSRDEKRQVFNASHVRSPAEQRAWVEGQQIGVRVRTRPDAHEGYHVNRRDKTLVVLLPHSFTRHNLLEILQQLD